MMKKANIKIAALLILCAVIPLCLVGVQPGRAASAHTWEVALTASYAHGWYSFITYNDISTFGVSTDATQGFNPAHDQVDSPPSPTAFTSYFWHPDNPTTPVDLRKLSTSIINPYGAMIWHYKVTTGAFGALNISWTPQAIATIPVYYNVLLLDASNAVIANMRQQTQCSFGLNGATTLTFTIRVDPGAGVTWPLTLSAGWNLISFPVLPGGDRSFAALLSDVSYYQVVTWQDDPYPGKYITPTTIEGGKGYWILVLEPTTITIQHGVPVNFYDATLLPGGHWHLIGSIYGYTVDATTIFGAASGYWRLWTWTGSTYITSTTIEPGKAYFANVHIKSQGLNIRVAAPTTTTPSPLFRDDFNTDLGQWRILKGTWTLSNNQLLGTAVQDGLIWAGDVTWTNYKMDATVKILAGSTVNEAAFIVGYTDRDNFYWLGLGCWGHRVSIGKMINGVPQEIAYAGDRSQVMQDKWYHIKVVMDTTSAGSTTLELYVDGALELQINDPTHFHGAIGIRPYDSRMQIEYISVSGT